MKRILPLFIIAVMLCTASVSAAPVYSDNARSLLSELEIMQGDPDGNMRYDDLVSRAECVKIAVAASSFRSSVATGSKTSPFSDVPYTHWASSYISQGVQNGLCKGYLDATFRPDNTVLYEEAATMFLRILGYTDSDFGGSWPHGQVGIAKNIGILDNVNKSIGDVITRRDVATMVYNTLNTKSKGAQNTYLSTFNRTIIDDVVLISTMAEDPSIAEGKIFTSAGTYNIADTLDRSQIGKRGSLVVRGGDTVVAFIPQGVSAGSDVRMVYSTLGNGIITYKNGSFSQVDVNNDTVFYKDSSKLTASAALSSLEMGDVLRISYKSNGELDYIMCTKGSTQGPKTVRSSDWYSSFGADSSLTVMRDGVKSAISDVKTNDIAYFLPELNIALVYSKKVTGIYESATPNKDAPASVTVSGKTYKLEGVDAFTKLSSSGSFNFGDTVTLLLGKSGDVADVATNSQLTDKVTGFLTKSGTKETTVSGKTVTKPYVEVILPSGEACEYITNKDYSSILNSTVSVTLKDGVATVSANAKNNDVSGKFTWNGTSGKIGSDTVSQDVKIIEVSTTTSHETATVASVFPQRLNGITLSKSSILYAHKSSEGQIDAMILDDTTGDIYSYGILAKNQKADKESESDLPRAYEYIINGVKYSFISSTTIYSASSGQAIQVAQDARGISSMKGLDKATSGKITEINGSEIKLGSKTYIMSDKVQIYVKKSYEYTMITIDELADMKNDYSASIYHDKDYLSGGRVRVIVLS